MSPLFIRTWDSLHIQFVFVRSVSFWNLLIQIIQVLQFMSNFKVVSWSLIIFLVYLSDLLFLCYWVHHSWGTNLHSRLLYRPPSFNHLILNPVFFDKWSFKSLYFSIWYIFSRIFCLISLFNVRYTMAPGCPSRLLLCFGYKLLYYRLLWPLSLVRCPSW